MLSKGGPHLSHLCFANDIILLGKAKVEQAFIIKHCLDVFCTTFGQKVSFSKSKLLVSRNVTDGLANSLSAILGVPLTKQLGKYLGVPSIQSRINMTTYNDVLERVQDKPKGWKSKCLSMARRVTLIKVVTSSIPSYVMQSAVLLRGICSKIDKCNRRFLWGGTDERRRLHKVKWERVCCSKEQGGLGIRQMKPFNNAMLSK